MAKFNAFTAKVTNCPPCLSMLLGGLGYTVANGVDTALGTTYCASPSWAFLN